MPNIKQLKNYLKGEDCFVIGNGPSVRDFDLSKILERNVITSNCFHQHKLWPEFKNIFHIELNGAAWRSQNAAQWKVRNLLRNKNAKYILREKFMHLWDRTELPNERKYYLRLIHGRDLFTQYIWEISNGTVWANTGIIEGGMALAQYMGCKEIYLIGCDATPYVDNMGRMDNAYFYDIKSIPREFWPLLGDNEDYIEMIKSWRVIKKLFSGRGIKIYNLTKKGNLDMFDYMDYDEAIKQ